MAASLGPRLVASLGEAEARVLGFEAAVRGSPALAGRLAYHRAWLAVRGPEGWRYAPARYAGHADLDPDAYVAAGAEADGRAADAALGAWFTALPEGKRRDKHLRRLREMFARLGTGSAPNAAARILEVAAEPEAGSVSESLVALMVAVYRDALPPSAQAAFRRRIGG